MFLRFHEQGLEFHSTRRRLRRRDPEKLFLNQACLQVHRGGKRAKKRDRSQVPLTCKNSCQNSSPLGRHRPTRAENMPKPVWISDVTSVAKMKINVKHPSNSNYDSRHRDPNRDRDRNRRESKEFDPDRDFDFDFDCTDVP